MQIINYNDQIPGLTLIEEFVTPEEEASLVEAVDQKQWAGLGIPPNPELKRRTQQYGHLFSYRYRFDFNLTYTYFAKRMVSEITQMDKCRKVLEDLGPFPEFANPLVDRIMDMHLMPNTPNHLLVNEYNAGQGIMPHTGNTNINLIVSSTTMCIHLYVFKMRQLCLDQSSSRYLFCLHAS